MQIVPAQDDYEVKRLNINDKNDDFGPQMWKNYLVFCSERQIKVFGVNYKDSKTNKGVTNIIKSRIVNDSSYALPSVFSKNLLSNHHDGPVSFSPDGSKIFYSRPLDISNSSKVRNNESIKLGIFQAEFVNGEWVGIKPLDFNSPEYNSSQPAISPDGSFIVFASDHPDSYGGADLFVSQLINGEWSDPINLGMKFNTGKSEYFPFIHYNGDLYFASNGLGQGGDFDIYHCAYNGTSWDNPVALPAPFNSEFDDYSYYINYSKHQGYFASNREGPFDIYHFEKSSVDQYECSPLIEETFCFKLPNVEDSEIEGLPLKFEYLLNDNLVIDKDGEMYCFPEVGSYKLTLNVVDSLSGEVIFTREHFEFLIERVRQPFIHAADSLPLNGWVDFDTKGTYLPRINLDEYLWDFGDNSGDNGESVRHFYAATGQYKVTLTIFGKPIGGQAPQFCAYKTVYVGEHVVLDENVPVKNPLDLAGFIRMADYSPLPDNLYYTNLVGDNDEVKMTHLLQSIDKIPLSDARFNELDTTLMHVFQDRDDSYNYYYGQAFNLKDAYSDFKKTRKAGFGDTKIKNLKNAKLHSDEYFIEPQDDRSFGFAVVLKKSKKPIADFQQEFSDVSALGNVVEEIFVPGEGYYYVAGNEKDINKAMGIIQELKLNGLKSVRIKDFSMKSVVASLSKRAEDIRTEQYMIEIFRSEVYLELNDSIFNIVGNRKIIAIRQSDRKIAYFVNGGDNLLAAQNALKQIRKKGFRLSHITNFKYERLQDEGYYISAVEEGDFSYVITFESSDKPIDLNKKFGNSLMGYSVYETYDPVTKKFVYRVDVGKELSEAVMLANDMRRDSLVVLSISQLKYNPLTDDEFYITAIEEGDEQLVIVLGTFTEKQNIYKTFSNIRSFRDIREIYDAQNEEYTYIIGGFESLEDAYNTLEEIKKTGIKDVFIRKFIYDPLSDDRFYLDNVNEEIELYRITLARDSVEISEGDPQFDPARDNGEVVSAFDAEKGDFVVAVGKSTDLPLAINKLGAIIEDGFEFPKVEKYVYSSMDKDRFAIRDLSKEDRYYAIQLFKSDTAFQMEGDYMRNLNRKYTIISKYDKEEKKYIYLIGDITTFEGARKYYKYARKDGYKNAEVVSILYETLAHTDFTIEPVSLEVTEYVVNLLRTQNRVGVDDKYFSDLPNEFEIEEVYDEKTGFYNYLIKNAETIHDANEVLARVKRAGYLTAHIDKMVYTKLSADEFTLETISDEGDDFTITLIRSKEKLGVDNPIFDKIRSQGTIIEYYDYRTEEYIYSFGKSEGMINAFEKLKVAQQYGFEDSEIQKFVYSELNADHFYLETIEMDESLFTIVLTESKERFSKDKFTVFEEMGYQVREKYIESQDIWVYTLSLTDNIAEAEKLTNEAKKAGFEEAKLNRFVYTPLSGDNYFLESIDEDEEIFMIVLTQSKERIDVDTDPMFDNLDDRYKVEEIYDEARGVYKYYIGKPMKNFSYAEALKKELIAMGYTDVRIIQFIYSTLQYDEFYIDVIDDSGDIDFVLKGFEKTEPLTVYFEFDQYYLAKKYQKQIDLLLDKTKDAGYLIVLEGHTDDIGESDYNVWLSKMRARSVKKYMIGLGVKAETITIIPKGETDPIAPNVNLENRRLNRSVIILPEKE